MSASSPAPSSTDDTEYCYNFTGSWKNMVSSVQIQPIVCLAPQEWRAIFVTAVIGIAAGLLLGFLVAATRHKLWHRSRTLKCFLGFVSGTLYYWLGHFAILATQPLDPNNSYITSTVLLYVTFGSFYSVLGYSLYGHSEKKAIMQAHERMQLGNNIIVFLLLLFLTDNTSEIKLLFVLWGLSMLKIIGRIFSFRAADKSYGTANTKLVATYMKNEHELGTLFDPSNMEGYKYLVIGEEHAEAEAPSYEVKLRNSAEATTVEDVWRCKGMLFKGSGRDRYRDMCLSFALFKLIKRRFDDYSQVEDKKKTRALVREGLLSKDDGGKRAFKVIKSELGFLRDLFHTKYPIASNPWILICNSFLFFAVIALALWNVMVIAHGDAKTTSNKIDRHLTTDVLVGLLILAEIWEFISYHFSDWGKVILICKYVKNYRRDPTWIGITSTRYCGCCFTGASRKPNERLKKEKPIRLKAEVKKAIFLSLKKLLASETVVLTNGITTLKELGHADHNQLGWACGVGVGDAAHAKGHTRMHTIMIWHIATSLCEMKLPEKKGELESRATVAISLSKYCAYLVVFAPELLPINSHSSKVMFKQMFAEARKACPRRILCGKIAYDQVTRIKDSSDQTVVSKGARLGWQLMNDVKEDAKRWELLERFWAELILFLAPSKHAMAHARKLAEGGEFITHLWALLYHARVDKRFPKEEEDVEKRFPKKEEEEEELAGEDESSSTQSEE